jgi:beta-glucuronidase
MDDSRMAGNFLFFNPDQEGITRADAKQGVHADALTRFGEEYQEDVYRRTLPMLESIPDFGGCTPWILCDFRSPRRQLPGVQDGWNLKGVIGHNGEKKEPSPS